jgi:hypothetical protein
LDGTGEATMTSTTRSPVILMADGFLTLIEQNLTIFIHL